MAMTRAEWEASRGYNEIFPPWSVATWRERAIKIICYVTAIPVTIAGFIIVVSVFGMIIEGVGQRSEDHDRCMKHATNGYEIEKCN